MDDIHLSYVHRWMDVIVYNGWICKIKYVSHKTSYFNRDAIVILITTMPPTATKFRKLKPTEIFYEVAQGQFEFMITCYWLVLESQKDESSIVGFWWLV
ncbi:hypothetical protein Avbf_07415 [Armadillidium vulgare]|nr:hypothetical protein Avbf_07415 [Armadillidium vulgare]